MKQKTLFLVGAVGLGAYIAYKMYQSGKFFQRPNYTPPGPTPSTYIDPMASLSLVAPNGFSVAPQSYSDLVGPDGLIR